jgi:Ran GTPase-activating protein (RanGAP) involved in mRNA processing and transport
MAELRTLFLRDNGIDALGAIALCDALPSVTQLRELDLSANCIGDAGVAAVGEPWAFANFETGRH